MSVSCCLSIGSNNRSVIDQILRSDHFGKPRMGLWGASRPKDLKASLKKLTTRIEAWASIEFINLTE